MRISLQFALSLVLVFYSSVTFSEDENQKSITSLVSLSGYLPGEKIDLHRGGKVGHYQDIVSLPGNGLPMTLGHKFDPYQTYGRDISRISFDIPQLEYIHEGSVGSYSNNVYKTSLNCGSFDMLNGMRLKLSGNTIAFYPRDDSSEPSSSRFPAKADYISPSNWYIECVTSSAVIGKNAFKVFSPNGQEYIFDVYQESKRESKRCSACNWKALHVNVNVFVSQISDKFQNRINYSYDRITDKRRQYSLYESNRSINYKRVRLLSLSSANDDREINLSYLNDKSILVETNGSLPLSFKYVSGSSGASLKVVRADDKYWEYRFSDVFPTNIDWYNLTSIKFPNGLNVKYVYEGKSRFINKFSDAFLSNWDVLLMRSDKLTSRTVTGPGIEDYLQKYHYLDTSSGSTIFIESPDNSKSYYYNFLGFYKPLSLQNMTYSEPVNISIYPKGTLLAQRNSVAKIKETLYEYTKVAGVYDLTQFTGNTDLDDTHMHFSVNTVLSKIQINQDGHSFITVISAYDEWGNPQVINEFNNNFDQEAYSLWENECGVAIHILFHACTFPPDTSDRRIKRKKYHYDKSNWIIGFLKEESIDGETAKKSYVYNENGTLKNSTIYNIQEHFTYHDDGSLNERKMYKDNALIVIETLEDYYLGIARDIIDGEGNTKRIEVYNNGLVKSETDFNGNAPTVYQYDSIRRLKSINPPIQATSYITWPTGLKKVITRGNSKQTIDYNAMMQPLLVTQEDTIRSEKIYNKTTYDSSGRVDLASAPSQSSVDTLGTKFTYDDLGRVLTSKHSSETALTRYCYGKTCGDGVQYGVRITDARGYKTIKNYRAYGNPGDKHLMLIKQQKAGSVYINTTIKRGKYGQIIYINQGGKNRVFTYKPNTLQLNTKDEPEVGVTQYISYDKRGNLLKSKVGNSGTTVYEYDNNNRIDFINYPGITDDVDYEYEGTNLKKIITGSNKTVLDYIWDELNNIKDETLSVDGYNFVTTYKYDNLGNIDSMRLPSIENPSSVRVIDHTVDALGRTREITGFAKDIDYYSNGVLKSMEYENGHIFNTTLNDKRLPENIKTNRGSAKIVDFTYKYDTTNNVSSITDKAQTGNNRSMGYDGLGRMTSANGGWGTGVITYNDRHDIDTFTKGGSLLAYGYDSKGRLSHTTGYANKNFSYDSYGNVISNGTDTFIYDDANQMTSVFTKGILHTYDGNKKRVKVVTDAKTVYYFYNLAGELLYRYDSTNKKDVEYINLNGKLIAKLEQLDPTTSIPTTPESVGEQSVDVSSNYPIYTWAQVDGATSYTLLLKRANGSTATPIIISATNANCVAGVCRYQLNTELASVNSTTAKEQWQIRSNNSAGSSSYSSLMSYYYSNNNFPDTDNDGLSNSDEIAFKTNPNKADTDGDGINDFDEIQQGTDPNVNIAVLVVIINSIILH